MDYYNHLEMQKHKAGRLCQQVASKAKYKLAVGKVTVREATCREDNNKDNNER